MLCNQRGGIISKVFVIPVGVVVILLVFIAGYFVGKHRALRTVEAVKPPALPEVISRYVPDKAEFTFYNTLTEKGEKTVSIDLKPRSRDEARASGKGKETPSKERRNGNVKAAKGAKPKKQRTSKKEIPPKKAEEPRVRYSLQVGSYEDKAMAEGEVRTMKQRGYAAFIVATDIPDKGRWYRVRLGSFSKKASAEKLAKELQAKEGISSFITAE